MLATFSLLRDEEKAAVSVLLNEGRWTPLSPAREGEKDGQPSLRNNLLFLVQKQDFGHLSFPQEKEQTGRPSLLTKNRMLATKGRRDKEHHLCFSCRRRRMVVVKGGRWPPLAPSREGTKEDVDHLFSFKREREEVATTTLLKGRGRPSLSPSLEGTFLKEGGC